MGVEAGAGYFGKEPGVEYPREGAPELMIYGKWKSPLVGLEVLARPEKKNHYCSWGERDSV